MADRRQAVAENVPGAFFVDATCIDCDTCRQLAPETFDDAGDYSYVHAQPKTSSQQSEALQALLSCPTGSIGSDNLDQIKAVRELFPLPVDETVYYCGFTSPKSFGGSSYFLRHPDGNWLIDSPKHLPNLVKKFEAWGGIRFIFLTHSDDVGDVQRYAEDFGATRIIHREELWSQPDSEWVIDGEAPVAVHPGFTVIPTPGHTKGHCVLLYNDTYLFTGDHMWWERRAAQLEVPHYYVWNQRELARSTEKLVDFTFEWILPGHGQRIHLPKTQMKAEMIRLAERLSASKPG